MRARLLGMVALLAGLLLASGASTDPLKGNDATAVDLKAQNAAIVAKTPEAAGVFVVADDGSIHHQQSGLVCPASYPNVKLFQVLIFPSAAGPGLDVGCDYIRPDTKGGADAKLTIFATKAADGLTLDQAFNNYRNEVVKTWPTAKSLGPALEMHQMGKSNPFPDFRSEEFALWINDRDYSSDLIVTIKSGWVIEIRATYSGKPNEIVVTKEGGTEAAVNAAGDRAVPAKAWLDALASIGG